MATNLAPNVVIGLKKGYNYSINRQREGEFMPSIIPVSDLKNYAAIVNQVTYGNRVYLTKNGYGQCALIDIKELDELDRQKSLLQLMTKLNDSKTSVMEDGTISADELEKELDL